MAIDRGVKLIRDDNSEVPVVAILGLGVGGAQISAAPALTAGTDRSGTITTANTAQQMAPANTARSSLTGQNVSAGDLWINEIGGAAAIGAAGSYKIVSGAAFSIATNRAISIVGATAGQAWTATET